VKRILSTILKAEKIQKSKKFPKPVRFLFTISIIEDCKIFAGWIISPLQGFHVWGFVVLPKYRSYGA